LNKNFRFYSYLFVIPYFFLWAIFFSYDLRNLSLIFPLWGIGTGIGFYRLLLYTNNFYKIKAGLLYVIAVVFIVIGINMVDNRYNISYYNEIQRHLSKNLQCHQLNDLLYKYKYANNIGSKKIATNYQILYYLPEFEELYIPYDTLTVNNENIGFVLWFSTNNNSEKEIKSLYENINDDKRMELEWEYSMRNTKYHFFKLLKKE
jgi:hypothetical protein